MSEVLTTSFENSTLTPEQAGLGAFEDFIKFSAGMLPDFEVKYKHGDQFSSKAYETFIYMLFDNINTVNEMKVPQTDPCRGETMFLFDDIAVLETRHYDETGAEYAVTYTAPPPIEILRGRL